MTKVAFYVLQFGHLHTQELVACRLAEKAYLQGRQVFIHVPDQVAVDRVDDLMWTFQQGSFLPHSTDVEATAPALIVGCVEPNVQRDDVLISLCPETPGYFSRFEQVIEIVANDEAAKAAGRARYSHYQTRGYELTTHKLNS